MIINVVCVYVCGFVTVIQTWMVKCWTEVRRGEVKTLRGFSGGEFHVIKLNYGGISQCTAGSVFYHRNK